MISRVLAVSLLSLGLSVFSTRAIATIPSQATLSQIEQPNLEQNSKPDVVNNAVNDQLLGVLAICLLATPAFGCAVHKQHLAYRKAAHHNKVKNLERVWKLPSKIR
ncbi:MAG: hypothetical protein LH702_20730 [Phormidesmis sp. CAN_BIN44]|nr:hypothetical protein [Phormidesmis sp. CAN_BIN44]